MKIPEIKMPAEKNVKKNLHNKYSPDPEDESSDVKKILTEGDKIRLKKKPSTHPTTAKDSEKYATKKNKHKT